MSESAAGVHEREQARQEKAWVLLPLISGKIGGTAMGWHRCRWKDGGWGLIVFPMKSVGFGSFSQVRAPVGKHKVLQDANVKFDLCATHSSDPTLFPPPHCKSRTWDSHSSWETQRLLSKEGFQLHLSTPSSHVPMHSSKFSQALSPKYITRGCCLHFQSLCKALPVLFWEFYKYINPRGYAKVASDGGIAGWGEIRKAGHALQSTGGI